MRTVKIGLNGRGRIGRTIFRELLKRPERGVDQHIQRVAVNNPGDPAPYSH